MPKKTVKAPLGVDGKFDLFKLPEFRNVKSVVVNNETLYSANDVARAIGFEHPRMVVIGRYQNGTTACIHERGKGRQHNKVISIKEIYKLIISAVNQYRNKALREKAAPCAEMLFDLLVDMSSKPKQTKSKRQR